MYTIVIHNLLFITISNNFLQEILLTLSGSNEIHIEIGCSDFDSIFNRAAGFWLDTKMR